MTIGSRRAAVTKALGRARRLGIEIDPDPAFHTLIECWVKGELTMPQIRERYLALLKEREQSRREWKGRSRLSVATEPEDAAESSLMGGTEAIGMQEGDRQREEISHPRLPKRRRPRKP